MSPPPRAADSRAIRERIASVATWYHTIELAPGVETPGIYDMRPLLELFGFPEDLTGRSALDVGAADGFFSFHLEALGAARVVATDLATMRDHDVPAWYLREKLEALSEADLARLDHDELHGGFAVAHAALGSRVERRLARMEQLPTVLDERFDLVFCSNVLEHLRDPVAGLEGLAGVTAPGGLVILGSPVEMTAPDQSYAMFVGRPDIATWWVPSREALRRMCRMAGFRSVEWKGRALVPTTTRPDAPGTMGVVHCRL